MIELLIICGLPGSGKSTWARNWVAEDPTNRARINRDDARAAMHGGHRGPACEAQVTTATHAAIAALLADGISVIEDGTNLPEDHRFALQLLAVRAGVRCRLIDLRDVPLQVCLDRNSLRTGRDRVPPVYIEAMHRQYIVGADPLRSDRS